MKRRAIVVVALLAIGACSSSDSDDTAAASIEVSAVESTTTTTAVTVEDLQSTKSIAYSTTSRKQLDIYSPGNEGSWPVVVVVHGASQSKARFVSLAEAISARGAVVFNLDFSTGCDAIGD